MHAELMPYFVLLMHQSLSLNGTILLLRHWSVMLLFQPTFLFGCRIRRADLSARKRSSQHHLRKPASGSPGLPLLVGVTGRDGGPQPGRQPACGRGAGALPAHRRAADHRQAACDESPSQINFENRSDLILQSIQMLSSEIKNPILKRFNKSKYRRSYKT